MEAKDFYALVGIIYLSPHMGTGGIVLGVLFLTLTVFIVYMEKDEN